MRGFGPFGTAAAALLAAVLLASAGDCREADKLRVGRPAAAFSFVPLDIGMEKGLFQKEGIEIEPVTFSGGAKLMQGLLAGAVDVSIGSGSDFAYMIKGLPITAVAAAAGPPNLFGVIVLYDSPIKTIDDLKAKKIGIAANGAMTQWLALEIARHQGWDRDAVTAVPIGTSAGAEFAALLTHQIDADITSAALGFQLEESKQARLLLPVSDYVGDVVIHMISATKNTIAKNPDAVGRFLRGWFATIAYMRANKAETVTLARPLTGWDRHVEEREYDQVMPMFSDSGQFTPGALHNLEQLLASNGAVPPGTDFTKLLTERFLPKPF